MHICMYIPSFITYTQVFQITIIIIIITVKGILNIPLLKQTVSEKQFLVTLITEEVLDEILNLI